MGALEEGGETYLEGEVRGWLGLYAARVSEGGLESEVG